MSGRQRLNFAAKSNMTCYLPFQGLLLEDGTNMFRRGSMLKTHFLRIKIMCLRLGRVIVNFQ